MKSITVKVSSRLSARVATLAKKRKISRSEVVRQAIEAIPDETPETDTILHRVRHLVGVLTDLPKDLSTNKKYMRGFGE
jgi:metal-responsive CopG/Arc/MetJ family transcriptional regulator